MKFARFEADGEIAYGIVEGDAVNQISAAPFEEYETVGPVRAVSDVKLLAPVSPYIVFFMGGNYMDHLAGGEPPAYPQVYTKTPNSIIGPGETIVVPGRAGSVQEEAELVAIIGKPCRNVSEADALDYVFSCVRGAVTLPDGRIVAGDYAEIEVRFFDTEGTYLNAVGRVLARARKPR